MEQEILDRLNYLTSVLEVPAYVGVTWVATKMGVSEQHLRNHFWLLPDLGRTEVPGRLLWRISTVNAWLSEIPPAERDRQWNRLSPSQKAAFARRRSGS